MKFNHLAKIALMTAITFGGAYAYAKDNNAPATDANPNTSNSMTNTNSDMNSNPDTAANTSTNANTNVPTPAQDQKITSTIKSEIAKSPMLKENSVNVTTNKGVVSLSGNVDSDSQASGIIEIAQSIIGVQDVDADKLKVKESKQPFTDMMTTAKAKGLLIREDIFGTKDIASLGLSVETNNGVVYLTGTVDNKDQINNAIKLIEGMKGVKKVEYRVSKSS